MRSTLLLAACAVLTATVARADEPVGCDKFKWPLDKERATLTGTDLPKVVSGARVSWPLPWATLVGLTHYADAKLPFAPERAPKSADAFAGFISVASPVKAGGYKITLSSEGWIDVIQNGQPVKSTGFTGATGCEGVRKSVAFDLAAAPFTLELSGIPKDTIGLAVSRR